MPFELDSPLTCVKARDLIAAMMVIANRLTERIHMTTEPELARQILAADFRAIIADTEELLLATAGQAGDKAVAARERIQQRLRTAKEKLAGVEAAVVSRTRSAARATDGYVHVHPWTTAGIAAGVGLLIGMLISRR